MSTIDIRDGDVEPVDRIKFTRDSYGAACILRKHGGVLVFEDADQDGAAYALRSEDIDAAIRALQKAKQLGWGE